MHQRTQGAHALRSVQRGLNAGSVGHVGVHVAHLAARACGNLLAQFAVQVDDDNVDTLLHQSLRTSQAQARSAACDQGGHVFQFHRFSYEFINSKIQRHEYFWTRKARRLRERRERTSKKK